MKNNQIKSILLIAIITLSFGACKEKTPSPTTPPQNESELITTVKLVFTDTATKAVSTAVFSDLDGPGGNAPTQFDTIQLKPNRVYQTAIYLLDETKNPVDSTSNEVLKEGQDHLFVFTKTGVNISFIYTDKDINNLPIGLYKDKKLENVFYSKMLNTGSFSQFGIYFRLFSKSFFGFYKSYNFVVQRYYTRIYIYCSKI